MALNENGEIVETEFVVEGRKQPLVEIRERTLRSQEKYMRQRADDEHNNITSENLVQCLKAINEYNEGESLQSMRDRLKVIERTRHLKIWHDLSTIANHGHLVFMVSCLYDPAIHYLEFLEFLDREKAASSQTGGPVLHHFRSSTFKREEEYLQKCWNQCLENRVTLPIKDIQVEGEHGQMKIIRDAFKDTTDSNNDVGIDQEQPTTGKAFLYNILEWNS